MSQPIRIVTLAEVPRAAPVAALWLYREWGYRYPGRTPGDAIALFGQRANTDRLPMAWIALRGETPVATASLVEVERPGDEVGPWVGGVFVIPSCRGQGLAVRLMQVLEAAAPGLGARRLLLSAAAPELYLALGYAPTGATKNGEPVMEKRLVAGN
jgi:GNAT superfamily N-acetyltransferase